MRRSSGLLAASALLIATPALVLHAPAARAQATTTPEGETSPTANDALRMKAASAHTSNPTEQNYTNPHTVSEQPGTSVPKTPLKMTDTGARTSSIPREQGMTPHHITVPKSRAVKQPR